MQNKFLFNPFASEMCTRFDTKKYLDSKAIS